MTDSQAGDYLLPPRVTNYDGEPRTVGMELEFAGVDIEDVARQLAVQLGGELAAKNAFVYQITGTAYGEFTLELDSAFLKERRYREFLRVIGAEELGSRQLDEVLLGLATLAVPLEVVTPPVALENLHVMDRLRCVLHRRKALGTGASLIYAFGLHINAEAPSLEAEDLLNVLRAFLLLYEWLKRESDVDPARALSPYIDPFPDGYVRQVLDPEYAPSLGRFMDDYLAANPTRNRALDMLPLFAHLDEPRVKAGVQQPDLVSARPAFHYRLPNCRVDEPNWSIAAEWNRWVEVERLAADPRRLRETAVKYLARPHSIGEWLRELFR